MENKCSTVSQPEIHVNKSEVLVGEKVHITVSGLNSQQRVTILSSFDNQGKIFASCGHYIADGQGRVDLACHSSLGGSFSGIQSMGLFTSAKQLNGESRLLKKDTTTPFDITLTVHDGHVECDSLAQDFLNSDTEPLAVTSLKRWYHGHGVRRIPIKQPEWLKGALFLPSGEGPVPGIIEVSGLRGEVLQFRAALFASHGYAALALDHNVYDEIPIKTRSTDYLLDACDWFSQHPMVSPGGVAMFTISTAVSVSLWMAMHNDNIWERNVKALFINGEDDMCIHPRWMRHLEEVIPHEKRDHFKFLFYPGAGHVIDPPYSPKEFSCLEERPNYT